MHYVLLVVEWVTGRKDASISFKAPRRVVLEIALRLMRRPNPQKSSKGVISKKVERRILVQKRMHMVSGWWLLGKIKPNLVGHLGGKFKAGEGSSTLGREVAAHDRRDNKYKASMYVDIPKKGAADKTLTSIQKKRMD